jgi:hypothetical protein
VKLEAGYREQRAWLSVGMTKITVELACHPWKEKPIVVTYAETRPGEEMIVTLHERQFDRTQLDEARALFTRAGRPNHWPHNRNTESVQSLNEKED